MGRTGHMEAVIYVHDEDLPANEPGGEHSPIPLFYAYGFLSESRESGARLTFTAKGPEAQRAIKELASCIETPPSGQEARVGAANFSFSWNIFRQSMLDAKLNGGIPSPVPPRAVVGRTIEAAKRGQLKKWGLLEAYDRKQAAQRQGGIWSA